MRGTRELLIATLILFALLLACFFRLAANPRWLLVDGERSSVDYAQRDIRPLGNDLIFLFLPHYVHVSEQVSRLGRLPHWDSSGFGGRPLIGNPQACLFYPPFWIAIWAQSPAALGWVAIGHLLWAGLGTYLLMRGLGANPLPSLISAGCFAISPYLLAHTYEGHYPHIWAVSWYSWAFCAYGLWRKGRLIGALALPLIFALCFLAGHLQEWYYLVFTLGVWVLADVAMALRAGSSKAGMSRLLIWGALLALTIGLVAIELVPDLIAQRWTLRSSRIGLGRINHYHLHPLNLFQLLGPAALGTATDYFGHDNLWESLFSIGLMPLILATIAVVAHPDRRLVRGWSFLVLGAVVFAAGRYVGLFTLLYELVPGMNRFRVPARSLFLASLGGAVLAGLGVETLLRHRELPSLWQAASRRLRKTGVALVVGLLILTTFAGSEQPTRMTRRITNVQDPLSQQPLRRPTIDLYLSTFAASRLLKSGAFWLSLGGAVALLSLGAKLPSHRRSLATLLGVLALSELAIHGASALKVTPPERFLGRDLISTALARSAQDLKGPFRIRARDTLYSDLRARIHGFEKININDSFQIQHAADLYENLYALLYVFPRPDPNNALSTVVADFRRQLRQAVLDCLGVAFLIPDYIERNPAWPLVTSGTWRASTFAIHRNPTAMPRAYVVPHALLAPEGTANALARIRDLNFRQFVLMTEDPLKADGPRQPFTPAQWLSTVPDHLRLRVETKAPGLLVIADTWMPGWSAQMDGQAIPILRGNHAQRVIPIEHAGPHEIVLRYQSPGWTLGLTLTLGTLLIWAAICWGVLRRQLRISSSSAAHTLA